MNTPFTDPLVRPVLPTDLPAIHAIYAHSVLHETASWEVTPPDLAEMARRMSVILDGGYPYLVAECAGRLVGYSYASSYRPRIGYRFTVENSVYIAADMQRRGLGRLLLSDLVAACTARGYRQMVAVIGDSQNLGSIQLHRALGFEQRGFLPGIGYKFGRWLDSVIMQRSLGDGATTMPAGESG